MPKHDQNQSADADAAHRKGQKAIRFFIHLFSWIGIAALYYLGFSIFFDTPLEHAMKNSTAMLREEYGRLEERYDSVQTVLDNVVERDRNVFRILFESDPYDLTQDEQSRWITREQLLGKGNRELNYELSERIRKMDRKLKILEKSYSDMYAKLESAGEGLDRIPSIQPVINRGLTSLTASFGLRIHPFYKSLAPHQGVDYTVPEGSRVFATADGRVSEIVRRSTSTGLSVVITHGDGYETVYNHLSRINVNVGQQVRRGDIIALSGNTGLSLAPHLHYEVHHNGIRVDPIHYFFMELSPAEYRRLKSIALSGMQSFD